MSKSLPYSSSPNLSAGIIKTVVEHPIVVEEPVKVEEVAVVEEPVTEDVTEEVEKKPIKKKA